MELVITGTMIYYCFVCKRKLWYFLHDIKMEVFSEEVSLGKLLDENSYVREDKQISIDGVISIDFIRERKILHEVKKSKKIEEANVWQLKYYLYYLQERGVDELEGRLDYPLLRQGLSIKLDEGDIEKIQQIVCEIEALAVLEEVPCKINSKICKQCAFHDFCYL